MGVKGNVAANYVGQIWKSVIGLIFVPIYIRFLGVEAYGLIGMFAILQTSLALLDLGMKPALAREMARFTAGIRDGQSIVDLLRSVEIVTAVLAALVAVAIWSASGWLATDWVTVKTLASGVVSKAFCAMGLVIALRFIENVYVSCLVGLQRQVIESSVGIVMATARAVGALGILKYVAPTVEAFFLWQAFVSLCTVPVVAAIVYSIMPACPRRARFSMDALRQIWRFAAGMMVVTALSLLLTQVDKILLSRLLSLQAFGYYSVASVIAGTLYLLAGPIGAAFYPRFTELSARQDQAGLTKSYHEAAQVVTVIMGTAAVILISFPDRLLDVWTGTSALTLAVAPLLRVLALGTLMNALMGIPYLVQIADGWVGLTVKVNVFAVLVLIPAIFWVAPRYGALGAAWVWVTLNAWYLVVDVYFMHRRLLPTQRAKWYLSDVGVPIGVAALIAMMCGHAIPARSNRFADLVVLALTAALALAGSAMAAPVVRSFAIQKVRNSWIFSG